MSHVEPLRVLDQQLLATSEFWQPQPFRELQPAWCLRFPALVAALRALADNEALALEKNPRAALEFLVPHVPEIGELLLWGDVAASRQKSPLPTGRRWAWEIPGRKLAQIESFLQATPACSCPVLDWCGGKGHLGRLLAWQWQQPVRTLEIDATLCAAGEGLAQRLGLRHEFMPADALTASLEPFAGQHAVALHACGHLHRTLIRNGVSAHLAGFDLVPCCYHLGVQGTYPAFTGGLGLTLAADAVRLAVTETVTASPRLQRQRDREMAWKLGFDLWRRSLQAGGEYRNFKPVPAAWFRGLFEDFLVQMAARENLPAPLGADFSRLERQAWVRHQEVMRLSLVRSAFRRFLERWLLLDMAAFLEQAGYAVALQTFCSPELTPRNLLLSARR